MGQSGRGVLMDNQYTIQNSETRAVSQKISSNANCIDFAEPDRLHVLCPSAKYWTQIARSGSSIYVCVDNAAKLSFVY